MAYAISTSANYHWIRNITASTHGDAVLKLTIHGDPDGIPHQFNWAEVTLFMFDEALVERLIAAINGAQAAPVEPEQTEAA